MVELLAAAAIISIIAGLASPIFVRMMRDKRARAAAEEMARMFETARARARGRGAAVLVRWDGNHATPTPANPAGHLTVFEAIQTTPGNCGPAPAEGCCGTWNEFDVAAVKYLTSFDERAAQYDSTNVRALDDNGTQQAVVEVCFSPRGRTFVRYAGGQNPQNAGFTPLTGVVRLEVENTRTGLVRQVIVPPTGNARVRGEL